jgi:hypothetical protein
MAKNKKKIVYVQPTTGRPINDFSTVVPEQYRQITAKELKLNRFFETMRFVPTSDSPTSNSPIRTFDFIRARLIGASL